MGEIKIKDPYGIAEITTRGKQQGADHITKLVSNEISDKVMKSKGDNGDTGKQCASSLLLLFIF